MEAPVASAIGGVLVVGLRSAILRLR